MGRKYTIGFLWGLCLLALAASPVQARFPSARQARKIPRVRIACLPSPKINTWYPDPFALGRHSYRGPGLGERNGIVYTCRGGHIDLAHLRKVADWTACLAYRLHETILAERASFTFKMHEPSVHHVWIEYPETWKDLSADAKDETAREIAIELGQYLAYNACVWHEILTWFGYKGTGFFSEYVSAFSWEDNYSNVLGSHIGAMALRDPGREYNEAVTVALDRALQGLGVQPRPAARRAGQAVHRTWFTGNFAYSRMIRRHFDIGLDDGLVTPWLVPGVSACRGSRPEDCPAPDLAALARHGFAIRFEIEPREWESAKILAIVYPEGQRRRLEPARHFGPIMDAIRTQAVARYGPNVGHPGVQTARHESGTPHPESSPLPVAPDFAALARRWLTDENS